MTFTIGCSTGGNVPFLESRFSSVVGIDLSVPAIKYVVNMHLHAHFGAAVAQHLPFPNETFDFVLCAETIEHIPPTCSDTTFTEMYRVLRREGMLLVTTPNGSEVRRRIPQLILNFAARFLQISELVLAAKLYHLYVKISGSRTNKVNLYRKHEFVEHINVLTASRLRSSLKAAGFSEIKILHDTLKPIFAQPFEKFAILQRALKKAERMIAEHDRLAEVLLWHQIALAKKL